MITKEELLQKGVSEEIADEIIATFDEIDTEDDSLLALQKALDKKDSNSEQDLFKADEGDKKEDNDDKDDYDESYMKKYMSRYMKKNMKSCQKMMKEIGGYSEKMSKAIEDFDLDSEGAVVEMTDLKPFLDDVNEVFDGMSKAISTLADRIIAIEDKTESTYDLMHKAATVQADQAKEINEFLSVPQGRKGVVSGMNKAQDTNVVNKTSFSKEDNDFAYKTLQKALHNGEKDAGTLISVFESNGHDLNNLRPAQRQAISTFISKGVN